LCLAREHRVLAALLLTQDDFAEAMEHTDRALELLDERPREDVEVRFERMQIYYTRGMAYTRQDLADEAIDAYRLAIAAWPDAEGTGESNPNRATIRSGALCNLAQLLHATQSDEREVRQLAQQALDTLTQAIAAHAENRVAPQFAARAQRLLP
jgi:tetratricopeptide (TPR) repeat protein